LQCERLRRGKKGAMKKLALVALVAAVVWSRPAAASFKFRVPDGWVDLSPGAPEANFAQLPPTLAQQIKSMHLAFYAADVAHGADGFMENVNVQVEAGATAITPSMLAELSSAMDDEIKKQGGQVTYRLLQSELVKVGGVTSGRYVGELGMGGQTIKQVGYIIPGHQQHAILTYSTTPADFDHYRPIFDAAAQATQGAEEPLDFWQRILARAAHGALWGGLAGGLGALVWGVRRKKRAVASASAGG
jgi:hypothetical protein